MALEASEAGSAGSAHDQREGERGLVLDTLAAADAGPVKLMLQQNACASPVWFTNAMRNMAMSLASEQQAQVSLGSTACVISGSSY